jgi:putative membrane protein
LPLLFPDTLTPSTAEATATAPGVMHWGYGMMGWFGPIFMLVFWVLIIIAAVYIIKWIAGLSQSETFKTSEAPLDILKKRYAKGEITKAEFEEMKKDVS